MLLADLRDVSTHEPFVEKRGRRGDGVTIWVNNAGADVLTGEAARWPFERKLDELWRVDVTATLRLSRLVGARMKTSGSGAS